MRSVVSATPTPAPLPEDLLAQFHRQWVWFSIAAGLVLVLAASSILAWVLYIRSDRALARANTEAAGATAQVAGLVRRADDADREALRLRDDAEAAREAERRISRALLEVTAAKVWQQPPGPAASQPFVSGETVAAVVPAPATRPAAEQAKADGVAAPPAETSTSRPAVERVPTVAAVPPAGAPPEAAADPASGAPTLVSTLPAETVAVPANTPVSPAEDPVSVGEYQVVAGNPDQGAALLRQAIESGRAGPGEHVSLGWALLMAGRPEESKPALAKAIEGFDSWSPPSPLANPDHWTAAFLLDRVAEVDYVRRWASDPQFKNRLACVPWFYVGQRREVEGRAREAADAYRLSIELGQAPQAHPIWRWSAYRLSLLEQPAAAEGTQPAE